NDSRRGRKCSQLSTFSIAGKASCRSRWSRDTDGMVAAISALDFQHCQECLLSLPLVARYRWYGRSVLEELSRRARPSRMARGRGKRRELSKLAFAPARGSQDFETSRHFPKDSPA